MRGSPLAHALCLLAFLALMGVAFVRVTRLGRETVKPKEETKPITNERIDVPYRLVLSAQAREISLDVGQGKSSVVSSGTLSMDAGNPVVFLKISWADAPVEGETRFAKLILEWPGRPTMTHVFDAPGDIDDVWEIPEP